jgi:hypothetical protein
MSSDNDDPGKADVPDADYSRRLGVIEALVVITRQCPSGSVRAVAEGALEAVKSNTPGVLDEQAYLMLTAMRGWRGERATQVRESLAAFLDRNAS